MQVSVENTSSIERRLTVQIPAEDIQSKVDRRLRELSKEVRIRGFRPGRVPMTVIKQRYGAQVRQEIVSEAMQSGVTQAIQKESLRPASMPRIEEPSDPMSEGDLTFSAVVEVYPELENIDVSNLEIERPDAEVSDADVENMLETLRKQRANWVPVDRTPVEGDQVLVEYVATTEDTRIPKEGEQRVAIIIGDSGFDSLESAVRNMKPDDRTNAQLTFPENYRESALAGKEAEVELTVKSISETKIPEVDEEFIKSFGVESGEIEDLRKEIRANLERELKQARTSVMKVNLIESLIESHPNLEVPASTVRHEAISMAARATGKKPDEVESKHIDLFLEAAGKRVRGGLLLAELARQNDIQIDADRVRDAIDSVADTYEQPDDVRHMYYGNQQLLQQVENTVLEEQVVDWVMDHAEVSPVHMSFDDVIDAASRGKKAAR